MWCGISHGLNEWGSMVTKGWLKPHHIILKLDSRVVVDCVPFIKAHLEKIVALGTVETLSIDQVRAIVKQYAVGKEVDVILDIILDER